MKPDGRLTFESTVKGLNASARWVDDGQGDYEEKTDAGVVNFNRMTGPSGNYGPDDPVEAGTLTLNIRHMKHLKLGGRIRVTIEVIEDEA